MLRPDPTPTAADALRFAREWAEQGVTGITIVNSKGESYDIDRFGMIVSTIEDGADANRSAVPPRCRQRSRNRAPPYASFSRARLHRKCRP